MACPTVILGAENKSSHYIWNHGGKILLHLIGLWEITQYRNKMASFDSKFIYTKTWVPNTWLLGQMWPTKPFHSSCWQSDGMPKVGGGHGLKQNSGSLDSEIHGNWWQLPEPVLSPEHNPVLLHVPRLLLLLRPRLMLPSNWVRFCAAA